MTDEQITAAYTAVKDKYGLADAEPMSTATQAATYGNEMKFNTLLFSLIAALLMLIYIWIRFEWRSGIMAVAALTIKVLVSFRYMRCSAFRFDDVYCGDSDGAWLLD